MKDTTSKKSPATPEARPLEVLLSLPPDAVMNVEEVRIYSRLKSRQAVYNWLNDKKDPLPASKHAGWRVVKSDLDAYLRRRHNRRDADQPEHDTSDESLRRHLALMIEVCKTALEWKRAGAMLVAAGATLDLEFVEQRSEEFTRVDEQLKRLLAPLSERTLTSLRFMLPSIHSDLTLQDEPSEELAPSDAGATATSSADERVKRSRR